MQISWLGYNSFRITGSGVTLLTDPIDPASGFKIHKQSADIVVSSVPMDDVASAVGGSPFVITQPGEYEVKSLFVHGVSHNGNTMYVLTIEDIVILFLGSVKITELSDEQLSVVEGSDIVLMPVGGGVVCSARDAVRIINQVEPRIVIPSYYKISGSKDIEPLETFLKEYSAPKEEMEKYKVSKKDLQAEDTRLVILKQS